MWKTLSLGACTFHITNVCCCWCCFLKSPLVCAWYWIFLFFIFSPLRAAEWWGISVPFCIRMHLFCIYLYLSIYESVRFGSRYKDFFYIFIFFLVYSQYYCCTRFYVVNNIKMHAIRFFSIRFFILSYSKQTEQTHTRAHRIC